MEVDHYGIAAGNYLYFNLPLMTSPFASAAGERSLPFLILDPNRQVVHTTVYVPAGWQLTDITPRSFHGDAPGGSQVSVVEAGTNGGCIVTESLVTRPAVIAPADYRKLLAIQAAVGGKAESTFLLQRR